MLYKPWALRWADFKITVAAVLATAMLLIVCCAFVHPWLFWFFPLLPLLVWAIKVLMQSALHQQLAYYRVQAAQRKRYRNRK